MGLTLTAAPGTEPIALAEAKLHCKVDVTDDDALITALIVAARRLAEQQTGRALVTQQWKQTLDAFPVAAIALDLPPLQTVESLKYYDTDGAQQTLAAGTDYTVHTSTPLGLVAPAYGTTWPATRDMLEAVEIAFTAGYGAAAAVPQEIKQWMLLQIGHWYENREASGDRRNPLPYVDALLDPYRVLRFG
jgi:uncharacterized phiE125 gp8 family phage protein